MSTHLLKICGIVGADVVVVDVVVVEVVVEVVVDISILSGIDDGASNKLFTNGDAVKTLKIGNVGGMFGSVCGGGTQQSPPPPPPSGGTVVVSVVVDVVVEVVVVEEVVLDDVDVNGGVVVDISSSTGIRY